MWIVLPESLDKVERHVALAAITNERVKLVWAAVPQESSCLAGAPVRLENSVPLLMGHQGCQHCCEEQKVVALFRALCLWQDNRCLSTKCFREATEGTFVAASSDEGKWKAHWAVWDGAKVQQPQRNLKVKVFRGCVGNDQLWFREWTKMWEICV